ncbi:hypothetical protein BH23CHL2_BH23CHL2_00190 [soil metagenome]
MAHGLEARVPFLDTSMVALDMTIDPVAKRFAPDGKPVEKWVQRKACDDLLPASIIWRTKAQFATGSGFAELFNTLGADGLFGVSSTSGESEEDYYRAILSEHFQDDAAVNLTTDWRDNRLLAS